jgi:ABC-type sugar transport system ATPase subunit
MIRLNDLSKHLGDFILDGINLTVQDNEYFVILGPTGAGKTVLLETIAGMYQPDKGEIWINGCNVNSPSKINCFSNTGFIFANIDSGNCITPFIPTMKIEVESRMSEVGSCAKSAF